jgi:hypothetical protein
MRVNFMAGMRGVAVFAKLWKRRTTIELPDATKCDLLSLPDLIQAKKTQRDKIGPCSGVWSRRIISPIKQRQAQCS